MKYLSLFSGIGGFAYTGIDGIILGMANKYTKTPYPPRMDLVELYQNGLTQRGIGEKYGVSQKVVWRWFRDLAIDARVPKNDHQDGANNPAWKGDKAGYSALHYRLYKERGQPQSCERCKTTRAKRFEWANKSGKYADINDYIRLCSSCHAKMDNKVVNITNAIS